MYLTNIDPKKTAILVIDMQNDFIKPGANIYSHMGYQMCDKLNEFLDINRQKGSLIIYSQNMVRADLLDIGKCGEFCEPLKKGLSGIEGTEGVQIFEKVAPKPGDVVLTKTKYSFFLRHPAGQYFAHPGNYHSGHYRCMHGLLLFFHRKRCWL